MIKVGIVGAGFGAKIHLPGFNQIPGVKVEGIYGKNLVKAYQIAKNNNIPLVFKTWPALVNSKKIDVVSIATPPFLHAKVALLAIKNKKAVLCEKPLALTANETKQMLAAANKNKIINAVDFEWRYLPAFKMLKKIMAKKTIGRIRSLNVVWTNGGRANANAPISWVNYKKYGGGMLLNYASHVINYLEWIFGPINQVSGKLLTTKQFKGTASKPNADDLTMVNFKLGGGLPGNLFITNVVYKGQGQQINIYGDKGTITLLNADVKDYSRNFELFITYANKKTQKAAVPKMAGDNKRLDSRLAPFTALAADFIKGIKKQRLIAPSFAEGHRTQVVLDAIKKSNQLKKWVRV